MTFPYMPEPILPGERSRGGGANRLIDFFNELRQEIAAMQATCGVNPQGNKSTILERLLVRHATSGLQRGMIYPMRADTTADGTPVSTVYSTDGSATNIEVQPFASEIDIISGSEAYAYYGSIANPTTYSVVPTRVLVWPSIRQSDDPVNNGQFWRVVTVQRNSFEATRCKINCVEMVDNTGTPQFSTIGTVGALANSRFFHMVCIGGQIA